MAWRSWVMGLPIFFEGTDDVIEGWVIVEVAGVSTGRIAMRSIVEDDVKAVGAELAEVFLLPGGRVDHCFLTAVVAFAEFHGLVFPEPIQAGHSR